MLLDMHASVLLFTTLSALRMSGQLSPRNANYDMKLSLDPVAHTVAGHETLSWRNPTRGDAHSLVFHLYMNAFKNQASTFYKESKGVHRISKAEKHGWGAIEVTKLVVAGKDLTAQLRVDDTLGTVELPAPVAAGANAEIVIDWKTRLPEVYARTGFHEDFFAVTQFFPKIGVWDCPAQGDCRWRAHQHHLNSEFFADYGVYDVELTLPKRFVVGATGVLTDEKQTGDQQTLRYHAEDVHDFAIVASPRFVKHEDAFQDALGEVKISLLAIPGHEANAPRHLAATKVGLAELTRRFGPYPYTGITVVDVPDGAEGAGGMEYPTLFLTADAPVPASAHLPEYVTIHELAHQYFYGIVGSDEVEEAWLDEGLTETVTDWGIEREFGPRGSLYDLFGHTMSATEASRLRYRARADLDPLETRAFEYVDMSSYGAVTYAKTNVVLRTLEALLGAARFEPAMRNYYQTWRFKHPRLDDFEKSFDEGAKEDLSWYWNATLSSTQVLDYEVLSVESRAHPRPSGLFDSDGGLKEVEVPAGEKAPFTSDVVVHRRGELVFPVELRVVFDDGSERKEKWDGGRADGLRWRRFHYEGEHKVRWAGIDPDDKISLDVRRINNALREEPDSAPRGRMTAGFSAVVSTLLAWVGF